MFSNVIPDDYDSYVTNEDTDKYEYNNNILSDDVDMSERGRTSDESVTYPIFLDPREVTHWNCLGFNL